MDDQEKRNTPEKLSSEMAYLNDKKWGPFWRTSAGFHLISEMDERFLKIAARHAKRKLQQAEKKLASLPEEIRFLNFKLSQLTYELESREDKDE